jgi:murein DD-endopeptidase MepM/ murein hydrolase activator NlpD
MPLNDSLRDSVKNAGVIQWQNGSFPSCIWRFDSAHPLLCLLLPFAFLLFTFYGCATIPQVTPSKTQGLPGIYHRVEKSQTLWSISKAYNIDLDELVKINHISDAASIEIGQLIFIPRIQSPRPLSSKYLSDVFTWPAKGRVISTFGQVFNNMLNKGINIQTLKSQDVVAAREGRVTFYSPEFSGFGKTIIIDHGDGFSTVYARNSEVFIKAGDMVEKGALISRTGSTQSDKNIYLHFEIRKGHLPQNPYFYLPR